MRLVWNRSKKGSRYNRCAISIHSFGLSVYEEIANGTYKNVWSDAIDDISYCVAEPLYRRVFAWIARSTRTNELECHVILCKTSKAARHLAELLAKAFQESYRFRQRTTDSKTISGRCAVCQTIGRENSAEIFRQNSNDLSRSLSTEPVLTNRSQGMFQNDALQRTQSNNVARAFVRAYETNSLHSSTRRSIDNDHTLADQESIKPLEYYRN